MVAIAYEPVTAVDSEESAEEPSIYLSRAEIAVQWHRIHVQDDGQIEYYISADATIPVDYDRCHLTDRGYQPVSQWLSYDDEPPQMVPPGYPQFRKHIARALHQCAEGDALQVYCHGQRDALIALARAMYSDPCILADLLRDAATPTQPAGDGYDPF